MRLCCPGTIAAANPCLRSEQLLSLTRCEFACEIPGRAVPAPAPQHISGPVSGLERIYCHELNLVLSAVLFFGFKGSLHTLLGLFRLHKAERGERPAFNSRHIVNLLPFLLSSRGPHCTSREHGHLSPCWRTCHS